jgi:hypothetical protein
MVKNLNQLFNNLKHICCIYFIKSLFSGPIRFSAQFFHIFCNSFVSLFLPPYCNVQPTTLSSLDCQLFSCSSFSCFFSTASPILCACVYTHTPRLTQQPLFLMCCTVFNPFISNSNFYIRKIAFTYKATSLLSTFMYGT